LSIQLEQIKNPLDDKTLEKKLQNLVHNEIYSREEYEKEIELRNKDR